MISRLYLPYFAAMSLIALASAMIYSSLFLVDLRLEYSLLCWKILQDAICEEEVAGFGQPAEEKVIVEIEEMLRQTGYAVQLGLDAARIECREHGGVREDFLVRDNFQPLWMRIQPRRDLSVVSRGRYWRTNGAKSSRDRSEYLSSSRFLKRSACVDRPRGPRPASTANALRSWFHSSSLSLTQV